MVIFSSVEVKKIVRKDLSGAINTVKITVFIFHKENHGYLIMLRFHDLQLISVIFTVEKKTHHIYGTAPLGTEDKKILICCG